MEKSAAFDGAEEVCDWDSDVVEEQFARVLTVHADLLERLACVISGKIVGSRRRARRCPEQRPAFGSVFDRQADEAGVEIRS
jgi:hypothetical protein